VYVGDLRDLAKSLNSLPTSNQVGAIETALSILSRYNLRPNNPKDYVSIAERGRGGDALLRLVDDIRQRRLQYVGWWGTWLSPREEQHLIEDLITAVRAYLRRGVSRGAGAQISREFEDATKQFVAIAKEIKAAVEQLYGSTYGSGRATWVKTLPPYVVRKRRTEADELVRDALDVERLVNAGKHGEALEAMRRAYAKYRHLFSEPQKDAVQGIIRYLSELLGRY